MGSKYSIIDPNPVLNFSKNYFRHQILSKEFDVLLIFEFLCQYKCISKTSSEKFDCKIFRISCSIFSQVTFYFWKSFSYSYYSNIRLFWTSNTWFSCIKKSYVKKLNSFQHFGNFFNWLWKSCNQYF